MSEQLGSGNPKGRVATGRFVGKFLGVGLAIEGILLAHNSKYLVIFVNPERSAHCCKHASWPCVRLQEVARHAKASPASPSQGRLRFENSIPQHATLVEAVLLALAGSMQDLPAHSGNVKPITQGKGPICLTQFRSYKPSPCCKCSSLGQFIKATFK
eukprot:4788026-Amphidinium_carterae.1